MVEAMPHRGPDGTGLALYRSRAGGGSLLVRVHTDQPHGEALEHELRERVGRCGADIVSVTLDSGDHQYPDSFATLELAFPREQIAALTDALEADGRFKVHSVGQQLMVVKDCLAPRALGVRHGVSDFVGSHGVGHARLATESAVNVECAHPFWARPFPDVAIVHHGHITNYFRWRHVLEQRGYRFATRNDSEVLAVYVADQMSQGYSLEEALERSIQEMDGIFTYVASYPGVMGVARDRWAALPLVVAETDDLVVLASEELQVLQALPQGPRTLVQPMQSAVMTWKR
jgi:glutamate synthase domain-containing protein 1